MEAIQANRMMSIERDRKWPAVVIVKGIPDHPEGAIRFPRPEQREMWQKMGICRMATETEVKESDRVWQREAKRELQAEKIDDSVATKPVAKKTGKPRRR